MSKKQLIVGTLILSLAGIVTKVLGFIYKIFLSSAIGAINLGLYQLIFPVYIICHTIYASGIQTALSKIIATNSDKSHTQKLYILFHALFISGIIATFLSILVYACAPFIAQRLLLEPQCETYIKYLSFVFPFCAIACCINGYHYGQKNAFIPAISQLIEQCSRILVVMLVLFIDIPDTKTGCTLAVIGLIAGEISAFIFSCLTLNCKIDDRFRFSKKSVITIIYSSAYLTLNRLLINILSSIEAALIPFMLRRHGLSQPESLFVYGTLFGMSLPLIFFPATFTSSFAVMLLPEVSNDNARGNNSRICNICNSVITICGIMSSFAMTLFVIFGNTLGALTFNSPLAGNFIMKLALIAPFTYITGTFASILNGLDKTAIMFRNSVFGMIIRIICLTVLVPRHGIMAYICGLIISQIIVTMLDYNTIRKILHTKIDFISSLFNPLFISFILLTPTKKLYTLITSTYGYTRLYSLALLVLLLGMNIITYTLIIIKQQRYQFIRIIGKRRTSVSN